MMGGKANIPLSAAFCCSCWANARISLGSAVEAMTNSTGKLQQSGSAGGTMEKDWIPRTGATFALTSGRILKALRLRSSHGFNTTPQNPLVGDVIWKVKSDSGMRWTSLLISLVDGRICSSVELDGVWTTPKITPWSSDGASSFADWPNISTASTDSTPQAR